MMSASSGRAPDRGPCGTRPRGGSPDQMLATPPFGPMAVPDRRHRNAMTTIDGSHLSDATAPRLSLVSRGRRAGRPGPQLVRWLSHASDSSRKASDKRSKPQRAASVSQAATRASAASGDVRATWGRRATSQRGALGRYARKPTSRGRPVLATITHPDERRPGVRQFIESEP